ncbi:DegT/DnrJ/EryC1/StrS family aminotransferase [Halobacterium wangiae]|uniref:DegT/DnrJ/EryC1/StrS family aminotransferase n=1 Tax=Halobacterium wangiae TaxID=2902623 RepID=UPI001E2C4C66|nr:DegT/DnrJ/EryC1/StrS family aminotransferase [Halobacterium wangiae]
MDVDFTDIYVDDEILESVESVLRSTRYIKGPELEAFEEAFARHCGVEHAVGVSSGTSAILLALQSVGVGEGDDVFVPGHTFFATVSPVLALNANPVFVDIDPETYTMDPEDLIRAIESSDHPTAVFPVHIYGQMADMSRISEIAEQYDLKVVEDACQAHFAERNGDVAGTIGDAGAFSFYPSKNMTVAGDGGMLMTDDDDVAEQARMLRNHGRNEVGEHVDLGLNYRMDEVRAAVGNEQLAHIDEWNTARNQAAQTYSRLLADVDEITTPFEADGAFHVYHLYVIQAPDRDKLQSHLEDQGIDTGIHYPTPAHEHEAVVERRGESSLPTTEDLADHILSLPMHPRISEKEIEYVCDTIEEYYR